MESLISDKIEMLRSNKGGAKIIHRGYMYTIHKRVQGRIRWRCSQRTLHCKGSITTGQGPPIINLCHNHIPDMHALARARCKSVLIDEDYSANPVSPSDSTVLGPAELIPIHNSNPTVQTHLSDTENEMEDSPASPKSLLKPSENVRETPMKSNSPEPVPKSPPPSPDSEMCLRWNSHHANMSTVIPALMDDEKYVDVTLMTEGKVLKCHKLILSSCSTYFDEMLKSTNSNQQTVVFLRGIEYWQIRALVDFMYKGEVNIDQSKLELLLKAAEDLQIKGLTGKGPKPEPVPEPEQDSSEPPSLEPEMELKSEKENFVDNSTMDEDEEYFPQTEYKRGKYKRSRKRKTCTPPDPSLLKHVKINLRGTKSRPNIKQPKFFSPDYPEYDPDRCVSPPKEESDPLIHIDNIKIEPIDIEVPQSPTFFEMNTMMDKSISEKAIPDPQTKPELKLSVKPEMKLVTKPKELKVYSRMKPEDKSKDKNKALPSTSKEGALEISNVDSEAAKIPLSSPGTSKDVLNINKKAIIVKCQNVKKFMDENASIQKILDAATTKTTLSDTEKSKLPQIRVRNLPTTDTMLKKFATTQLTSILKKGEGQAQSQGTQHIILKKIGGTKPTILRHSLPAKTEQFTTEIVQDDEDEIVEKISLLTKTKKELGDMPEMKNKEEKSDSTGENE